MNDLEETPLCSNCFSDQGLRLDAERFGLENRNQCVHCHSTTGRKLTKKTIEHVAYRFFVLGTMRRTKYGAAPTLQLNYTNQRGINPPSWLAPDVQLLKQTIGACIFHYGPRLWMVGEIEPLKDLQELVKRQRIVERIVKEYPVITFDPIDVFYRLRVGPKHPSKSSEYDSPPSLRSEYGRLDSAILSVMYASQDVEVCIHECRATAEDDLYIATLNVIKPLKLLNLNYLLPETGVTEFESLDLAVHMLFLAGKHSYEITRELAYAALSAGFDGLSYPSYFSLLRTGSHPFETQLGMSNRHVAVYLNHTSLADYENAKMIPNLALFGSPIAEGAVRVRCLNRLALNRVAYDGHFGPVGVS